MMIKEAKERLQKRCSEKWKKWSWRDTIHGLLPITEWLPKYKLKKDLLGDLAAGLTLGIMNIPQGLSFAMLASLPPTTGLYTALVPVFAYVVLGTSKHLSVGTFAVIAIMVGNVIEAKVSGQHDGQLHGHINGSDTSSPPAETSGSWSPEDKEKILLSVTLCLVVGIIQTAMGFLRLGFIKIFLSDALVSGYTTGAAFYVFTTQFKHVIAIYPEKYRGPFALIKTYISFLKNITDINLASTIIGILCILILVAIKHVNEKYKNKLKFPIPAEFIVVALSAGISYGAKLKQTYHIKIVESVSRGLPPLSVPSKDLISDLFIDGFVIAVVSFSLNISLAKIFSQKNDYSINVNQELVAYGIQNIVGGFFSCFVSAASLGRSLIQENLGRTQITTVVSCAIILLVVTVLAPVFEPLPNAVLAAIVIVAIGKLFKNFVIVKKLWKGNKIDALIWIVTWGAVILFGIDLGLAIGVMFQILTLTYRLSQGKLSVAGDVGGMVGVLDDINGNEKTTELPGVVVIRFQSPLCFINAERFKEQLEKNVFAKCRTESSNESDKRDTLVPSSKSEQSPLVDYVHSVIIDCSSFSFIDSTAVCTLYQIAVKYGRQDVKIYLVNGSHHVLEALNARNLSGCGEEIFIFPTISEALKHAYERRRQKIEHFMENEEGSSQV